MLKYSYRCNTCGFTKLSNDKAEIVAARNSHKRKTFTGPDGSKHSIKCIWVPTGRGTVARPFIADMIAAELELAMAKNNSLVNIGAV